jgi:hypothetical protein
MNSSLIIKSLELSPDQKFMGVGDPIYGADDEPTSYVFIFDLPDESDDAHDDKQCDEGDDESDDKQHHDDESDDKQRHDDEGDDDESDEESDEESESEESNAKYDEKTGGGKHSKTKTKAEKFGINKFVEKKTEKSDEEHLEIEETCDFYEDNFSE